MVSEFRILLRILRRHWTAPNIRQLARPPTNAKYAYRPEKGIGQEDRWRAKVVVASLRTRFGSGVRHADQLIYPLSDSFL